MLSPASTLPIAAPRFTNRSLRVVPRPAVDRKEIDGTVYMFALCRLLQVTCLDWRGIDCRVDCEDAGRLPGGVCRMLGVMVGELVRDAGERPCRAGARPTVTVALHRRGATGLCTITPHGLGAPGAAARPRLERALRFAAELGGGCMVRSMAAAGTIAIMFDIDLVEACLPAAMVRYRAAEARHRGAARPPVLM